MSDPIHSKELTRAQFRNIPEKHILYLISPAIQLCKEFKFIQLNKTRKPATTQHMLSTVQKMVSKKILFETKILLETKSAVEGRMKGESHCPTALSH